jgi:hypothetical protein
MSYINESCGCDGGSNSEVINNSPILSGSQEVAFSPMSDNFSFLDGINDNNFNQSILTNENTSNNFSKNDDTKQNYSLDDLISMSNENNNSSGENKFSNNNIQEMNNTQFNNYKPTQPANEMLGNAGMNNGMNAGMNNGMNAGMNNGMNAGMNNGMNMPDPGMMRNIPTNVNPELQMVMNKIAQANNANSNKAPEAPVEERESSGRFILKNFNILLIVIIGLAWSDVAKFYINRSIKFGGGNHRYYVYYAVIATVVLYGTSKYIHSL